MRYRQLGTSGLTVSVVGLGCNNFVRRIDLERTRTVVDAALEVASPCSTPPTPTATAAAPRGSS